MSDGPEVALIGYFSILNNLSAAVPPSAVPHGWRLDLNLRWFQYSVSGGRVERWYLTQQQLGRRRAPHEEVRLRRGGGGGSGGGAGRVRHTYTGTCIV